MANRKKIKPKDVDIEIEKGSPWEGNPKLRRPKERNLGKERAEKETEGREGKPEYPI